MKSVAIYARVSSDQQTQQATIGSQVSELKDRAQADGHIVLPQDFYIDEGYSGATLARPALERLRDRVAEGAVETLYLHSPDRLARKYAYQVLLLDEFRKHGVITVFVHGPSGQTAEDELLVQMQGMIAEYERAKIMERCRRGKLHRARQGSVNPMSGAPYGFAYVKKSEDAPASYQVLLHEAKVVRRIFHALVTAQKSIGAIVRELNTDGIPTRRSAPRWDRSTVWAILQNPAYMGKAAFNKTESIERRAPLRRIRGKSATPRQAKSAHRDRSPEEWIYIDVPAIVSSDVFEAAKAQLERNKRLASRNGRGKRYLLQGLTVCGCCGYAFYGKKVSKSAAKGGAQYAYYRCIGTDAHRFAGGRICSNPQVPVQALDEYVWQSVCELLEDPTRVMQEWSRRQQHDGIPAELRAQHRESLRIVETHERTLKRLIDAYEVGAIDLDALRSRSEVVRGRIKSARREALEAERRLHQTIELRAVITQLDRFAARMHDGLEKLSWLDRQQLIRTLVAKVEIDEGGATIVYRVPSAEPGSNPGGSNPSPSEASGSVDRSSQGCQLRGRRDLPAASESLLA